MKLKHAAIIATVLIIIAGFAMISPLFLRHNQAEPKTKLMLSFNISQAAGASDWCQNLASVLNKYHLGASVFITGTVAEQYPQCVSCFSDRVDIGSATFSNLDLTGIADYSQKLQEVAEGKAAVDKAGHLISGIFQAPFGAIDQDIYSLLSRSGVLADFSYSSQYNVCQNGLFIRYDAAVYAGRNYAPEFFSSLPPTGKPLIINFDDTSPVASIEAFLSKFDIDKYEIVNASVLTGLILTNRG